MGLQNIVIMLLLSTAGAKQPEGVSEKIYDCNYDTTKSVYLDVVANGNTYKCGVDPGTIEAPTIETSPKITLNGATKTDYYTVYLSGGDDRLGDMKPIVHMMIANVKGSDLLTGFTSADQPSDVTSIIPYYRPNPFVPWRDSTYSYLVYKQNGGKTDFSALDGVATVAFDIPGAATKYNLTLLDSNYILAWQDIFGSMGVWWKAFWSIFGFGLV